MSKGRVIRGIAAATAVCAALAGCGSSAPSGPSALDPATHVPANVILYASVSVKPQGSARTSLNAEIDALAGTGAAKRLWAKLDASLDRRNKGVRGWLGQHVGVALTGLPTSLAGGGRAVAGDLVLIAPTNDPAAARQFIAHHKQAGMSGKVVGDYAIFGGQSAVAAALATTPSTSLAHDAQYSAAVSRLGSGELVTAYAALHQLVEGLLPTLQPAGASAPLAAQALEKAPPGSTAVYGLAATSGQIRVDVITHGLPRPSSSSSAPSDVSSLPGGSWIALALSGGLANKGYVSSIAAQLPRALAASRAAQHANSKLQGAPLRFVERDLLPALGPLELSVAGTSLTTLRAGLVISPLDPSAGARLVSAVKNLVKGLPISAGASGGRVAVTFGYRRLSQLLAPSSTLASDPGFKSALAQLPAGAKAGLYLNFAPLDALAALDTSSRAAAMRHALSHLRYLITGSVPGHFRLVLATS